MKRGTKKQQGIQSIEIAGGLLRALAQTSQPQMLRDLAREAHMPPAKAHRYLVGLGRLGLTEQEPETGRYVLGSFALELGLCALGRLDSISTATSVLRELRAQINQTVAVAVWANQGPTIVRWLGADTPVAATLRVGSVMPLTRSATGGAFLAYLPSATTADFVKRELTENVRNGLSPQTRKELDRWVADTKSQGFAQTSEFIPGIGGIAAPVFDHSGEMILALVALGYSKPFNSELSIISTVVLRRAAELSMRLGWRVDTK